MRADRQTDKQTSRYADCATSHPYQLEVASLILIHSAILIELRLVIDGRTDRHSATADTALA